MREYAGLADTKTDYRRRRGRVLLAQLDPSPWTSGLRRASLCRFADFVSHEPRDADVFAKLGDRGLDQLLDLRLRIADRHLIHQHDLLVEAAEFALDDLVDHLGRLAR